MNLVPKSQEEACKMYIKRCNRKQARTMYDVWLGAMCCCSKEEFNYTIKNYNAMECTTMCPFYNRKDTECNKGYFFYCVRNINDFLNSLNKIKFKSMRR